ncbi:MAG: hypothetical protein A3I05_08545 [Deltaproteobacteria bacterium RIFCSPLOWO2_02_FULL_44_10]|nr:MAG: hypothetical protein A3C46_05590 [Deltaproteobacteria bacterium RIFCSPHIGHO2_02_FULL_44_16]OGQ45529.1 MAG: hypothetical protein A3I05_08545 [Deltaproteobacteria bacterium RIFCSPLOWO2_02_FULL_44_10]
MTELRAKDIMTTEILTVAEEMSVKALAEALVEHEITGVPVTNSRGKLIGVVSTSDIAQYEAGRGEITETMSPSLFWMSSGGYVPDLRNLPEEDVLVRDIMTPTVYSVKEETKVRDIARTMISGRIHRVLVTRNDRFVGIVTSLDLLKVLFD